jgi:hypothetical protein
VHGIEMLAIDGGAGMQDANAAMADGNSTAGTYGVGLGAIGQSDLFDFYTWPERGTCARVVWASPARAAVAMRPGLPATGWRAGVRRCTWAAAIDDGVLLMLVDGLGHGEAAAEAADGAVHTLAALAAASPVRRLRPVPHARGLAKDARGGCGVARVDAHAGQVQFAGVGNIACCTSLDGQRRHLVSINGIVGHNLRKVQAFDTAWQDGMVLILHSDGLTSRWSLDPYPGLEQAHPALIAAVLYRDCYRGRDDVSVMVLRQGAIP